MIEIHRNVREWTLTVQAQGWYYALDYDGDGALVYVDAAQDTDSG